MPEERGLRLRAGGPGSWGLMWWELVLSLALTGGLGAKRLLDWGARAGAGVAAWAGGRTWDVC